MYGMTETQIFYLKNGALALALFACAIIVLALLTGATSRPEAERDKADPEPEPVTPNAVQRTKPRPKRTDRDSPIVAECRINLGIVRKIAHDMFATPDELIQAYRDLQAIHRQLLDLGQFPAALDMTQAQFAAIVRDLSERCVGLVEPNSGLPSAVPAGRYISPFDAREGVDVRPIPVAPPSARQAPPAPPAAALRSPTRATKSVTARKSGGRALPPPPPPNAIVASLALAEARVQAIVEDTSLFVGCDQGDDRREGQAFPGFFPS